MTFDTTTLILLGLIVLGLALMVFGLMSRRQRPTLERRTDGEAGPYVASSERPYVEAPPGQSVADEVATATTDVAGELLGVDVTPAIGPADDLTRLKGVGPKFVAQLNTLGITRFDQLAGMGETETARLDERLGAFRGRLARDRVVEQADLLARGDTDTFEERFGKLTP